MPEENEIGITDNILVLGNGFDLYHGLPTRYTDFLDFVRNWPAFFNSFSEHLENLSELKKSIPEANGIDFSKVTPEVMEYFSEISASFDRDEILKIDQLLKSNLWLKYFLKVSIVNPNWSDFESEIEHVALIVENVFVNKIKSAGGQTKFINSLTSEERVIVKHFIPDFFGNEYISRVFATEYRVHQGAFEQEKEKLLSVMRKELDNLRTCLCIYFSEFVSKVPICVKSEQIEAICETGAYTISFNYTKTFERLYKKSFLIFTPHYVHGEADSENIVLGFENEINSSNDYIYFQKYFQRIQHRTGSDYKAMLYSEDGILERTVDKTVHIWGHSLALTDCSLLIELIEAETVKKIIVYYRNQSQENFENLVVSLVNLFSKDKIIEWTGNGRLEFVEQQLPVPIE